MAKEVFIVDKTNTQIEELLALGNSQNGKITDTQIVELFDDVGPDHLAEVYKSLEKAKITIVPDENPSEEEFLSEDSNTPVDSVDDWDGGSMDSISIYLNDIGQYPLLSPDEELQLAKTYRDGKLAKEDLASDGLSDEDRAELEKQVKAGERAKNRLIESNLRFVVSIARRYRHNGVALLDLIQSGNLGLMRGLDEYDPDKGFRVTTYVSWWIRQAITRDIANNGRTIRIPCHVSEDIRKINAITRRLTQEYGVEPSDEMIAEEAGMTVEKVQNLKRAGSHIVSLDATMTEKPDSSAFVDMIEDENTPDPAASYEAQALREALFTTMSSVLTPREEEVIRMLFGTDGPPMNLREIGEHFNISRERARQIGDKALRKLKNTRYRSSYIDFLQK